MTNNDTAEWLTRGKIANELGVSLRTVDRLRDAGSLDWYRDERSGEVRVTRESFERYVSRHAASSGGKGHDRA